MISIYKGRVNANQQTEKGRVEFKSIVNLIKSDYFKDKFETLQSLEYGSEEYKQAKLTINQEYFTPQSFSKTRKVVEGLSGIICFDFDIKENKDINVDILKETLKNDSDVMCFHQTTGKGLKIYSKCNLNLNTFKEEYNYLVVEKENKWGVILDRAFNKPTQPCYLSWDVNIYYNPDSTIILTPEITNIQLETRTKKQNNKTEFTDLDFIFEGRYNNDAEEVLNVVFFNLKKYKPFSEGNYHLFCVSFAYICKQFGVSKQDVKSFLENKMGKKIESNCVSYPYSDDKCIFGSKELNENSIIQMMKENANVEVKEELDNVLTIKENLNEVTSKLIPIIKKGSLFLTAPMGVGKTYFALNILPNYIRTNIIFAVPRKIQVEQVKKEYPNADVEVCTWDTLKHKNLFYSTIVIDEAHLLVEDSEFREVPNEVISLLSEAHNVIFLTATPSFNSEVYGNIVRNLEFVTIKKEVKKQDLNLRVFEKKEFKNIVSEVISTIKKETNRGNKVVVNYNSINILKVLAKEVEKMNLTTEVIHSSPKLDHTYSDNILNNTLSADVTFTTKVFEVGLNIYNKNVSTIKIVNTLENCSSFLQFNARFRKGVKNSYLFLLKTNEKGINLNDCRILMDKKIIATQKLIDIVKEEQGLKKTIRHKEINSDYLSITKEFKVNFLYLLRKYNSLTNSFNRYIQILKENYNVVDYKVIDEFIDIETSKKDEEKEVKEAKDVMSKADIDELIANYNTLYYTRGKMDTTQELTEDLAKGSIYLQKALVEEMSFILSLKRRGITPESINEYRTKYKTKLSRKDIIQKLDIFLTKDIPLSEVRSDYKKTHLIYQKIREFGKQVLGKEMLFSTLLDGLSNVGIEEFSSRTVKSAFENVFKVKVKAKRIGEKVVKTITILEEMNYNL